MIKNFKIQRKPIFFVWLSIIAAALAVGFILATIIFNLSERQKSINFEINFVPPREAIVFWKTPQETIGFVKYGPSKKDLSMTAWQTSSVAGVTHGVILENVPLEGLYLSVHNQSDSKLLWPQVRHIQFDPTTIE